ncbi:MAG: S46 family peptidase [Gammaproteobacteria bacterium]
MIRRSLVPTLILTLFGVAPAARAAEGMWTLDNLPRAALERDYGFQPDAAAVDKAMKASVRLAGGCSGSFISPDGLVLTNAHCIIDCVQELSSAEQDLVRDGFVARSRSEERQCPAVELNRLDTISDVTERIRSATRELGGKAYIEARNAEKARIESECSAADPSGLRCDVVELYNGGLYHLYRYQRYQDVRLTFFPEYASGFFGGDPDNFNFPRYNLDMGLLRAYENGKPARVEQHFRVNPAGAQEGEMTLVTGHPGSTKRLLTFAQLQRERDVDVLNTLLYLAERRGLLLQYARQGAEQARVSATDLLSTENSYKVLNGRLRALADPAFMQRKRQEEESLRALLVQKPELLARHRSAWEEIAAAQVRYVEIEAPYQLIENQRGFFSQYYRYARQLVRAAEERKKPNAQRLRGYTDAELPRLQQLLLSSAPLDAAYETATLAWSLTKLRELLGVDDPFVRLVLGKESPEALAARLVAGTRMGDVAARKALWEGGAAAVAKSRDPFIRLALATDPAARAIRKRYEDEVEAVEKKNAERIAEVRFALQGTSVYPDATFTLRLSYGEVKGWEERGQPVAPFTTLAGLYARATGFDPFALAPSWSQARERLKLKTPFNFVTTNDIIGGNSGSPVLNRRLELVGLAFDGNIHSLGGAYGYDETRNRCVAVHSAAMVEALAKVYRAPELLAEINPL